ncbi:MAG: TRAP transporter TatT component family protein [Deltaproteobacteria bacterium]|nr:TRAP transporter TatT component family protein [Deltaproteobacteria bacterium]
MQKLAINSLANTLGESSAVFASDEDPELVKDALPFALKTMEALLVESPSHPGLLLSTCSGFVQYSYAFVDSEAFFVESDDIREARRLRERALKLYLRARDYCLRALDLERPGIYQRLILEPEEAVADLERDHAEVMYWTAASWGAAISLGQNRPELTADLPVVRVLLERALELHESFGDGALHEAMISIESLPESAGGSPERARRHFERALELSRGGSAGAYVTLAKSVSVSEQNRSEFEALLAKAAAIDVNQDPSRRLANVLAQRRAEELLARIDDYFLDSGDEFELMEESP